VQRKHNERPDDTVPHGTPPQTMLLCGPDSRQVLPIALVG